MHHTLLMLGAVSCALMLQAAPASGQTDTGAVGDRSAYLTPFATKPQLREEEIRRLVAFQFHGYIRAGAGVNTSGGNQVCFQAPGAPVKYRLGNECDAYTELLLGYDVNRTESGSFFRAIGRLAFDGGWLVRFQDVRLFAPELYLEGHNLFSSGPLKTATFWAGKRYYRYEQVHINDFYFWDLSNPGAGVEGIDLGTGKLAIAYFRQAGNESSSPNVPATPLDSNQAVSIGHAQWSDVPVNKGGTLNLGVEGRSFEGPREGVAGTYGLAVHILHTQKLLGGFNQLIFQYGQGLSARLAIASDLAAENSARTYRVIDWLVIQPSARYAAGIVAIYQRSTGAQSNPTQWVSFGARPIYNFTDHIRVALEVGADFVTPRTGSSRRLVKVTLAPELSAGRAFYARPELRVFVTYANWNQAAADAGVVLSSSGVSPFTNVRHGVTVGVQTEAWW